MTTSSAPSVSPVVRSAKRFGYSVAAAVNGVMIFVVHNIMEWELFGWLTADFDRLVPWLTVSFVAGIVLNLVYAWDDSVPIKSPGQIMSALVGLIVTLQTLAIFPFDFSNYDFNYALPIRIALWVAIAGIVFGAGSETLKLAKHQKASSGS